MCATLMGSAEVAVAEFSEHRIRRVVVDAGPIMLILAGVTDHFLLVAWAKKGAGLAAVVERVGKAASELAKTMVAPG